MEEEHVSLATGHHGLLSLFSLDFNLWVDHCVITAANGQWEDILNAAVSGRWNLGHRASNAVLLCAVKKNDLQVGGRSER